MSDSPSEPALHRENELRAALLSLKLATEVPVKAALSQPLSFNPDVIRKLPTFLRPMHEQEAVHILRQGTTELDVESRRLAGTMLARAATATFDQPKHMRKWVDWCAQITHLDEKDVSPAGRGPSDFAELARVIYQKSPPPHSRYGVDARYGGDVNPIPSSPPAPPPPSSSFDAATMISTAYVSNTVEVKDNLFMSNSNWPALLDPRNWKNLGKLFWKASDRRWLINGQFVDYPPNPGEDCSPGHSWNGYLYEYAVYSPNEAIVCGYQAILRVDYDVTSDEKTGTPLITLKFGLHSCRGGIQLATVFPGGINVDSGGERLSFEKAQDGTMQCTLSAWKHVRFSTALSRRTPQGSIGSGAVSSMLAPSVMQLWMQSITSPLVFK